MPESDERRRVPGGDERGGRAERDARAVEAQASSTSYRVRAPWVSVTGLGGRRSRLIAMTGCDPTAPRPRAPWCVAYEHGCPARSVVVAGIGAVLETVPGNAARQVVAVLPGAVIEPDPRVAGRREPVADDEHVTAIEYVDSNFSFTP